MLTLSESMRSGVNHRVNKSNTLFYLMGHACQVCYEFDLFYAHTLSDCTVVLSVPES